METLKQDRQREKIIERNKLLKLAAQVGAILFRNPNDPIAIIKLSEPLKRNPRNSSNYYGTNEINGIFFGFLRPDPCDKPKLDEEMQMKVNFEPGWSCYKRTKSEWKIIMEKARPAVVQIPIDRIVPHGESSLELSSPKSGSYILCISGFDQIEDWIFDSEKNKTFYENGFYEALAFLSQETVVSRSVDTAR